MSVVNSVNYSSYSPLMVYATADGDLFNRTHISNGVQTLEQHVHGGAARGQGLSVLNLNGSATTNTALANACDVFINSTDFTFKDSGGNSHTLLSLDIAKTITANDIFSGTVTFSGTANFTGSTSFTNAPSLTGLEVVAKDFAPSGLTGATAASRYVGGTTTGAPVSGTFASGDYIITEDGNIFVCTAPGTPGTWSRIGNPMTAQGDIIVGGASGVLSKLAKGSAYQYLRMNSGDTTEEWAGGSGGVITFQNAADVDKKFQQVASTGIFWNFTGSASISWPATFATTPTATATVVSGFNSSGPGVALTSISTTGATVQVSGFTAGSGTSIVQVWGLG